MRRPRRITQADYHAAGRGLGVDMTLADAKWVEPRYPGDAARDAMFRRGDEFGLVKIQHYGVGSYMVAAYLPGRMECVEGDTPKTVPEKHRWCETAEGANQWFEQYVRAAACDGWSVHVDRS